MFLQDQARAATFARGFIATYLNPALGAISKGETDNLVFALLIEAGDLDPSMQVYEIARKLNVTPAKARNLLFQWQLRRASDPAAMRMQISQAISSVRFGKDGDLLTFGVESPLVREELRSQFKRMGVFSDASFSAEIIRVPVDHFVDFMDDFFPPEHKKLLTDRLIAGRHVEDKSFKAVSLKIIKGLAGKAIGKGADALVDGAADHIGPFIKALFVGDGEQARKQSNVLFV